MVAARATLSIVACSVFLLGLAAGRAEQPANLLTNEGFADGLAGWNLLRDASVAAEVVPAQAGAYSHALRLRVSVQPGAAPWAVNLQQPVEAFLDAGHRLVLRVWMRSPEGCRVTPYVEVAREPWTKSIAETIALTPDWQEYELRGVCADNYAPRAADLGFHLGFDSGTIEITGVRLYDLDAEEGKAVKRPTPDTPVSLIENGELAGDPPASWYLVGGDALRASSAVGPDGRPAVSLLCRPREGEPPWSLQFGQNCTAPVWAGDVVYFRALLRSPDRCRVSFIMERSGPPHEKSISQMVRLTEDWREYKFAGAALSGYRPGECSVKLFLGHDEGTIEVASIRAEDFGLAPLSAFEQTIDYWGGRDHPDTWREAAVARIAAIRQGNLTVRVVDALGRPVPDAAVTVSQRRHHFRFGSAVPAFRLVDTSDPDNVRFQQEVERLYNTVTFENDLKWAAASEPTLAVVERASQWLRERGIDLRGHCLLWGSYEHLGPQARALRGTDLRAACEEHVRSYTRLMASKVYLWDVVNEAATNTVVWDEIGWDAFPAAFRWAREGDPLALLCYNDYGIVNENPPHRARVAERIRQLLDAGAPLDVLGIQGHMSIPLTPIYRVLEILDEWAAFGLPLEITEFDLGCPDDAMHAYYVRDFMTAVFSHPSVEAFIMWGFWEGSHWRAREGGAMFRRDWSKRPAQEAWEELVLNEWWTRWSGHTDVDGTAVLRAFYGTHQVEVTADGKTATISVELEPGAPTLSEVTLD